MSQRLRVLITGVGGRSIGHQILQALLLLGDKYDIVATDVDAFSYGLYQVDQRYLVPRAADPAFPDAIRKLVERERIDVILPGTEAEAPVLSRFQSELGCMVLLNPPEVLDICGNKGRLGEWLCQNGFHTPRTVCGEGWRTLTREIGYPVVAKPAENTGGSRFVEILTSDTEVEQYLRVCPNPEQALFQEYVGSPEEEYTVGIALSHTGAVIDSIVLRRKLMGLSLGMTRQMNGHFYALSTGYSQGFITRQPQVQAVCEQLAVKIGARGPLNIQCRLAGDKVYIFEVHPRFSGTTSIRAAAGFNEPDLLIRDFLGHEPPGRVAYQTDLVAIRAFSNLLVPLADFEGVQPI